MELEKKVNERKGEDALSMCGYARIKLPNLAQCVTAQVNVSFIQQGAGILGVHACSVCAS